MASAVYCVRGHYVGLLETPAHSRMNSHRTRVIVDRAAYAGRIRQAFCKICGAETIHACQHCQAQIELGSKRPAYCDVCGRPHPWTEIELKAAKKFTDELDDLSGDEKSRLKATFDDLIADTPKTEMSAHCFKKFIRKIGPSSGDVLMKIIVNIATEAAKKGIFLEP